MSFEYIQKTYGVPADKGVRVQYSGKRDLPRLGTITKSDGQYIFILMDGDKRPTGPYHPTWELRYLEDNHDK